MDRNGELHARRALRSRELDARIDSLIARIAKAQRPDGYFNTYFIRREPEKRWTNLRDWHELYCAGHMIEAAVAHAQATGKPDLLGVVRRYADYIATVFGPGPDQRRGYCGHPEIELALVKLYRFTGERRYLDLAKFFVDERGRQPHYFDQEAIARGDDPSGALLRHLRIQPVAHPGARAAPGGRACGARHVPVQRDGRPRRRVRRSLA